VAGDYLVSEGKRGPGSAYLILAARLVLRRRPANCNRWVLTCHRAELADVLQVPHYWRLFWYPRNGQQGK
jgi:hypothetical protein